MRGPGSRNAEVYYVYRHGLRGEWPPVHGAASKQRYPLTPRNRPALLVVLSGSRPCHSS